VRRRKPITILHLAGSGGWAGGETYLMMLAQGLDRSRFKLVVIVPERGALADNLQAEGIETLIMDMDRLGSVAPIFRLRSLLHARRPAILQTHGARANFYGRVAGRLAGTPVIISTIHNSLYDYPVGPLRRWIYLALDRLSARLAHCILCVAESHRRELITRYRLPPEQVVTIPNGVDIKRYCPAASVRTARQGLGICHESIVIGIIGRLTPQKGHCFLLHALCDLSRDCPGLRCLVVGDGELHKDLTDLAVRLGIRDRCLFLGARDDVPTILAALDILVVPSLSEGMPYVVLEGMAMARPVVATAVNGIPEVIQDHLTGRLVPRKDPKALADAIRALLADPPAAAAMGRAARRRVEESFSAEQWIKRMETFYFDQLDDASRRASEMALRPCPCGAENVGVHVLRNRGEILECRRCGLLTRAKTPSDEDLSAFYKDSYWDLYRDEQLTPGRDNVYHHVWSWVRRCRSETGVLVDVGCGSGALLALCRAQNWKGIGFDPSVQAVQHARSRGLDANAQGWPPCPLQDESADVVTCINVLDHLRDPFGALQEAWRILRPGGLLYIRVPNGPVHARIKSAQKALGLTGFAVFHLYGFGQRALLHHLPRVGFAVLDIRTALPSLQNVYHSPGRWASPLRRALKRIGVLLYQSLDRIGLNRMPWGMSLEVMARKDFPEAR